MLSNPLSEAAVAAAVSTIRAVRPASTIYAVAELAAANLRTTCAVLGLLPPTVQAEEEVIREAEWRWAAISSAPEGPEVDEGEL